MYLLIGPNFRLGFTRQIRPETAKKASKLMGAAAFWTANKEGEKDPDSESVSSFNDSQSLNLTQGDASSAAASVYTPMSRASTAKRTAQGEDWSSTNTSFNTPGPKSPVAKLTAPVSEEESSQEEATATLPTKSPLPTAKSTAKASHAADFWSKSMQPTRDSDSESVSSFADTVGSEAGESQPLRDARDVRVEVRGSLNTGQEEANRGVADKESDNVTTMDVDDGKPVADARKSGANGGKTDNSEATSKAAVGSTEAPIKAARRGGADSKTSTTQREQRERQEPRTRHETTESAASTLDSQEPSSEPRVVPPARTVPSSPLVAKKSASLVGRSSHAAKFWNTTMDDASEGESLSSFNDTAPSEGDAESVGEPVREVLDAAREPSSSAAQVGAKASSSASTAPTARRDRTAKSSGNTAAAKRTAVDEEDDELEKTIEREFAIPKAPRDISSPLVAKRSAALMSRSSHAAQFWKDSMVDGDGAESVSSFADTEGSLNGTVGEDGVSRLPRPSATGDATPLTSKSRSRIPGTPRSGGVRETDLSMSEGSRSASLNLERPPMDDEDDAGLDIFSTDEEEEEILNASMTSAYSVSRRAAAAASGAGSVPSSPMPKRSALTKVATAGGKSTAAVAERSVLDRVLNRGAAGQRGAASLEQLKTSLETGKAWVGGDDSFASTSQWSSAGSVFSDLTSTSEEQRRATAAQNQAGTPRRRPALIFANASTTSAPRSDTDKSFASVPSQPSDASAESLAISFSDTLATPASQRARSAKSSAAVGTPSSTADAGSAANGESDDDTLKWKKRTRSGSRTSSVAVSVAEGDDEEQFEPDAKRPAPPGTPSGRSEKRVGFEDEAHDPYRWNYDTTGAADYEAGDFVSPAMLVDTSSAGGGGGSVGPIGGFATPNTSQFGRSGEDSIFKTPTSILKNKGAVTPMDQPTNEHGNGYGPRPSGKPYVFEEIITPVNAANQRRLRKRLPPIDRSKNERYVYGYRGNSQMQTVVGVIRNVGETQAEKPYRRPINPDHQAAVDAPIRSTMPAKDISGAERDRVIVLPAPDFSSVDGQDNSSQIGEAFGGVTGWVRLAHGALQEFVADPDQSKIFFVCRGIIAVEIDGNLSRIPQFGCFIIPPGNQFKLIHASLSTLPTVLSFVALPGDHEPTPLFD